MDYLLRAKIYRSRFDKLNKVPNKSERLLQLISKIQILGLFFCFKHMTDERLNN
jgi:hypothetical protein